MGKGFLLGKGLVSGSGNGGSVVVSALPQAYAYLTSEAPVIGSLIGTYVKFDLPMTPGFLEDFEYVANGALKYIGTTTKKVTILVTASLNSNVGVEGYARMAVGKNVGNGGGIISGSDIVSYYDIAQGRTSDVITEVEVSTNDVIEVFFANVSNDNHQWFFRNLQFKIFSQDGVSTGAGGGHTIQDEGTPLTQQDNLNFVGPGVSVSNDGPNNATVVTVNAGSGGALEWPINAPDATNPETINIDLSTSETFEKTIPDGQTELTINVTNVDAAKGRKSYLTINNFGNNSAISVLNFSANCKFPAFTLPQNGLAANTVYAFEFTNIRDNQHVLTEFVPL